MILSLEQQLLIENQVAGTPFSISCKVLSCMADKMTNWSDLAVQDGWAPLHWASLKGPKTVFELLVQHGAEADVQNGVSR